MKIPSDIQELCKKPAAILNRYKDSGIKVIGYTCSYVPEELIMSAGMQPYRISNIGASTSTLTPSFICPFASAILENVIRLEDFFDGFVVAHTCDPMWRLYDILKAKINKPLFLLRTPHNPDNTLSFGFFRTELVRFKEFLERKIEAKINDDTLSDSIELCNKSRSLLKSTYMLNSNGKNKISAFDRFHFVLAGMWMPKPEFNKEVETLTLNDSKDNSKVRLHLNGTTLYDLDLIKVVEEAGGFIASDDLCTGSRYFWTNVEKSQDPLSDLACRYVKRTPCPSHGPLEDRLEYINLMIKEFKSQGILTFTEKFCDPILYDSVHVRNMSTGNRIPTMVVDYENSTQEIGRIKARVEAFVESIGG